MRNKQGKLFLAIVFGITIFIVGVLMVNFVGPEVTNARSATGLNCVNLSNISDGTKLSCLVVDVIVPYWFVIILSVAGGLLFRYLEI